MSDKKNEITILDKNIRNEYNDNTVNKFMKNLNKYQGRNRDILIRLGLIKPNIMEKELYNEPSWKARFKHMRYDNDNNV